MWRSLIVILAFIGLTYAGVDLHSESTFDSVVLPLAVVLGFIALAIWFVGWLYQRGANQRTSRFDQGGFFDSDAGD